MTEALGVVGAVASFVQLTDVSIRTCLHLYSFFSSLHRAQNEFQRHMIVIRDVHDAVQLIRQTIGRQSISPSEETLLRKHLLSITHELSTLEKVTAGKNPARLSVRLKWVMKSAETGRALQELEHRKTSLILLLRQSAQSCEQNDANQTKLNSLLSRVEDTSEISTRLDRLSLQMDATGRMYKESLDEGFSALTRDREVTIPEECMEQVLRRVLESYILPRVEEAFSKTSQLQNAATLQLIQEAMGQATEQIMNQVANTGKNETSPDLLSNYIPSDFEPEEWRNVKRRKTEIISHDSPYAPVLEEGQRSLCVSGIPEHRGKFVDSFHQRKRREWSYWSCIPAVGTFRIEYGFQSTTNGRFWTIQIDYWPSISFLFRKCISLRYSSDYDPQGYTALFPSLAVYTIISNDHPIWKMIEDGDIDRIKVQFQDNNNGPYDQDSHGVSLLLYAIRRARLDVVDFLLTQGADPTKTTACGLDGLYELVVCAINEVICPWRRCTCCHQLYGMESKELSLFFSIFHCFITAGCDPANYYISIFDVLEDRSFAELDINQELIENDDETFEYSESESSELYDEDTPMHDSGSLSQLSALYKDSYLTRIRQLAQFLRNQGLDLIEQGSSMRVVALLGNPTRMTYPVLRECGLGGNYRDSTYENMSSILYHGLFALYYSNSNTAMNNLIDMIKSGTDIHDVEWASEFWINKVDNDGVMTPTAYAKAAGFIPHWRYAMTKTGYDPDVVFLEDERRRREFRRLHGATSSAVEMEDTPSYTLRRRLV